MYIHSLRIIEVFYTLLNIAATTKNVDVLDLACYHANLTTLDSDSNQGPNGFFQVTRKGNVMLH